jgi:rhodanese-related sulfurtransferase
VAPSVEPGRQPEVEPEVEPVVEADAVEIQAWLAAGRSPLFVDIREPHEVRQGYVAGALLLPMNDVPESLALLPRDRPLVFYCAAGMRSFGVAHYLRDQGFPESWSLPGGIGAWLETGAPYAQAPQGTAFGLLDWVRLDGPLGRVVGIEATEAGHRYAVRVGTLTHPDLPPERLQKPGR